MDNSLIEDETRENPARGPGSGRALSARSSLDVLLLLVLPLVAGYEFVALERPSLPLLTGCEVVPIAWFFANRHEVPRALGERLAWLSTALLSLALFLGLSLPRLAGALPEFIRYELSLVLGKLYGGVPLASLGVGALALGASHLGGLRLGALLRTEDLERRRLHDLYFVFNAVLAQLTIVRYAGGPFFG